RRREKRRVRERKAKRGAASRNIHTPHQPLRLSAQESARTKRSHMASRWLCVIIAARTGAWRSTARVRPAGRERISGPGPDKPVTSARRRHHYRGHIAAKKRRDKKHETAVKQRQNRHTKNTEAKQRKDETSAEEMS
ncbi:unnamed protein product, partial [Ectocarpus sp. 12 AP-2014]